MSTVGNCYQAVTSGDVTLGTSVHVIVECKIVKCSYTLYVKRVQQIWSPIQNPSIVSLHYFYG
jgi:hypothetical protein